MPLDTPSLPPKEDFIAWLVQHSEEVVGLAEHLMIAGPVASWLRSLGFSEVVVTREQIMGINMTGFVTFGAPDPDWQMVLAAEESFFRGNITGRGMLERLEDFGP